MGFSDYSTAAKFKEAVGGLVREVLDIERPRQAYGIVDSIDLGDRYDAENRKITVMVRYIGDPGGIPAEPVQVATGSVVPTAPGQTVIIDGPRNARRVVAVIGDSTTQRAPVPRFEMNPMSSYDPPSLTEDGVQLSGATFSTTTDNYSICSEDGVVDVGRYPGTWLFAISEGSVSSDVGIDSVDFDAWRPLVMMSFWNSQVSYRPREVDGQGFMTVNFQPVTMLFVAPNQKITIDCMAFGPGGKYNLDVVPPIVHGVRIDDYPFF